MSLESVFEDARTKKSPYDQLSAIKKRCPDDIALGDLLWKGLREGIFQPGPVGYFAELTKAPGGFDAADVLKLLQGLSDNPTAARTLYQYWRIGYGGLLVVQLIDLLAATRGGLDALIAGWKRADPKILPLLGYVLACDGHIPAASLVDGTLSWVAWAAVHTCTTNRESQLAHRARMLDARAAVWPDAVWGRAVGTAVGELTQDLADDAVIGPIADHLTDPQLMQVTLSRLPSAKAAAALLRARGAASLPSLMALAEHWRDDESARGRSSKALSILMTAIIGIHLDQGAPALDPRFDRLLRHAMHYPGEPLLSVLPVIPAERLEPLMLTRSVPYTYTHLCPTPAVKARLIDEVLKLGKRHYPTDLPRAIVTIGAPMVPLIDAALKRGGGMRRNLLLDCLTTIGDAGGIAPLVRAFSDTGPRIEDGEQVCDIPRLAVQALARLAHAVPEADVLAALKGALGDADPGVRRCAVEVLEQLPPSPAILALVEALSAESDPGVLAALARLRWHLEPPEAVAVLRAAPEPRALLDVVWARIWDDAVFAENLPALIAEGPAILAHWALRMRRQVACGEQGLFASVKRWSVLLAPHAEHPAAVWLTLSMLTELPTNPRYPGTSAGRFAGLVEILPALPAGWLALLRSPARPRNARTTFWLKPPWLEGADDLLCDALSDPDGEVRSRALDLLRRRPAADLTHALPLLASRDKAVRLTVAQLLVKHPLPAALPHLLAAQKRERAKANKAALVEALAAYTPEQVAAAKPLAPAKKPKSPRKKKAPATAARPVWTDWLKEEPLATADATTWSALVIRIAQHPPLASEVTLIDAALARWPDRLRTAPPAWLTAASRRKQAPPYWSLARTVNYRNLFSTDPVKLTPARIRWLLTSPSMAGIRHLTLQHYSDKKQQAALIDGLAKSQPLAGLETLDLYDCGLGRSGLEAVIAATWMTKLTRLNLDHYFVSYSWSNDAPGLADQLRAATHLSNLVDLRLNLLKGSEWLEAVLTAPTLARVTTLHVGGRSCTDDQLQRAAADPRHWEDLDLAGTISTTAATALAGAKNLDRLTSLRLAGPIGAAGVMSLLDSPGLPALEELILHSTDVTDADTARIKGHPRTGQLQHFFCGSRLLSKNFSVSKK